MIENLEFHIKIDKLLKESLLYNKLKKESKKINLVKSSGLFNHIARMFKK